jgi:hypothetical protein
VNSIVFDFSESRRALSVRIYGITAVGAGLRFPWKTYTASEYRQINIVLNWFEELKERVPVP